MWTPNIERTMRRIVPAAAALVACLAAPAAAGVGEPHACDPVDSRLCRIATADTYLAALVSHDASDTALATEAWRRENGSNGGDTGADIADSLENSPIQQVITGIRRLRWYVDGEHATAVYIVDSITSPALVFERFRTSGNLIHEIEAIFYIDPLGNLIGTAGAQERADAPVVERSLEAQHGPVGPYPFPLQEDNLGDVSERDASSCGRGCVSDAVRAYLDALDSQDASGVPLHPDARRMVNLRHSGSSGPEIAASIEAGPAAPHADVRIWIDGVHAIAYSVLPDGVLSAMRIAVVDGLITEIEAVTSEVGLL